MTTIFYILAALQLADIATTAYAIRSRIAHESNPVMAWLIDNLGLAIALVIPKVLVLYMLYHYVLPLAWAGYIIGALVVLYSVVVVSNCAVIYRGKKA